MNLWLDLILRWGQSAIDEAPIVLDTRGGRQQLFVSVVESLMAKEHEPPVQVRHAEDSTTPLIAILLSGGMDSLFAYERALEVSKAEIKAFYVKMNTPYTDEEIQALKRLDIETALIDLSAWPKRWAPYRTQWRHILPLRNLALIMAVAERLDQRPAEIWMAATEGEIPLVGGDKSMKFFDAVDTLLDALPIKHTLRFPLKRETKTDLVAWWRSSGRPVKRLLTTITCQSPVSGEACGKCHACFNRWVALSNNGLAEPMRADPAAQLANAQKVTLMESAYQQRDFATWSEKRIAQTLAAWYSVHQKS